MPVLYIGRKVLKWLRSILPRVFFLQDKVSKIIEKLLLEAIG
jgi:hypothetical protein